MENAIMNSLILKQWVYVLYCIALTEIETLILYYFKNSTCIYNSYAFVFLTEINHFLIVWILNDKYNISM